MKKFRFWVIKQPTCYKNLNKLTRTDLILTNLPRMFQSSCVIQAGLTDSFASIKKKYARGNQMPFMSKTLFKETMTRLILRNKYLKHKTEENRLLRKQ